MQLEALDRPTVARTAAGFRCRGSGIGGSRDLRFHQQRDEREARDEDFLFEITTNDERVGG